MATGLNLAIGTVTLCVLEIVVSMTIGWLVFAYSCEKGFVSDYPVLDLWMHNVSNCFVRPFHFGYKARNEQIETSCHGNCFVFRLNTWISADFGLLSQDNLAGGPLNYYDLGFYPVNRFCFCVCHGKCFCGVWQALCYPTSSLRTVRVRRLCRAGKFYSQFA